MHYIDEGIAEHEPLVMIHGNPSWSFYFRHLISKFSDQYHCIAADHIGMGLSEKPLASEYQFTLEQRINDLESLLNKLDIKIIFSLYNPIKCRPHMSNGCITSILRIVLGIRHDH